MKANSKTSWLLCILILAGTCGFLLAQEEEEQGEGDRIEKRREWFLSSRRAGATDESEIRRLRWKGVNQTKTMMRAQQRAFSSSSWVSRGPDGSNFSNWAYGKVSGRIVALEKDTTNNILYAGAATGGLWKSTDDGLSWTSIFDTVDTTTVGEVALDPSDPDIIWAGTGENTFGCENYFGTGIWRSTNGGQSWEQRNGSGANILDLSTFASIVVDPNDSNIVLAGGMWRKCGDVSNGLFSAGIYKTTDAGATWTATLPFGGITDIARADSDVYWAASYFLGLYKSTDAGDTWEIQTPPGLPTGVIGRTRIAVAPSNSDYVYALFEAPTPQLWRTTDGGENWSMMASGFNACDGQCSYNMILKVHPTDPDTLIRGTILLYKSIDGGATWTNLIGDFGPDQLVHQDIQELFIDPFDGNIFYIGSDGGVWKTSDGGSSFKNLNGNLNVTQFYAVGNHPTDNNVIMGGAQDNASLIRTTSNLWDLQLQTGDGFVCHFNPVNPNIVYVASYPFFGPQVFRSTSGAFGPFIRITNGMQDTAAWVTPYILDPSNPNVLYVGTTKVYKSISSGSSWVHVGPEAMTNDNFNAIISLEVNRSDGNYVFAGTTDGKIWRTIDAGSNWTDITAGLPEPSRWINDIAGDRANPERAFAAVGGFNTAHLFEHTGSGLWIPRGNGLPNVPANTVFMRTSNEIYVGTDVGVYVSTDSGLNFVPFMDGLPQGLVITDLKYTANTQTLIAGTYGRGAWEYQFPTPDCGSADRILNIGSTAIDSINCSAPEVGWDYYSLNIPDGNPFLLSATLFGLTADADLYVRKGSKPNLTSYRCRPYSRGTEGEGCTIPVEPGEWWVGVNNFDAVNIHYILRLSYIEGMVQGTVTNAETNQPIAGASVSLGAKQTTTDSSGFYQIILPVGLQDIQTYAFGYFPVTNQVNVLPGLATDHNFSLTPAPLVNVSGTVTDGSGHGWPLYARIDIEGSPLGPVFTNPQTGAYSVELPLSGFFTFHVSAVMQGYDVASRSIQVTELHTENFALTVHPACTASGYELRDIRFVFEDFDSGLPSGWTVQTNSDDVSWRFDNPCGRENLTGGTNGFAIADSNCDGEGGGLEDTELSSPTYDLSGKGLATVEFNLDFFNQAGANLHVGFSTDGGASWNDQVRLGGNFRGPRLFDLFRDFAGEPNIMFRFRYFGADHDQWVQIDNFTIKTGTECIPKGGGLLIGNVYDANHGSAVNLAQIAADDVAVDSTISFATSDDPEVDDGFYIFWSSETGPQSFTASKPPYGSNTQSVNIIANQAVVQNFNLAAGQLIVSPNLIEKTLTLGQSTTAEIVINNIGTVSADFKIAEFEGNPTVQKMPPASKKARPLKRIRGHFTPGPRVKKSGATVGNPRQFDELDRSPRGPADLPWAPIANYPTGIADNVAVAIGGKVYSFGGYDGFEIVNSAYLYDPASNMWSSIASMGNHRDLPAVAAINEEVYIVGGINNVGTLEIYDTATDSYTTGASIPTPVFAAPGVALDGLFYVIGGSANCSIEGCDYIPDVQVYDPGNDFWTTVAPYPEPISSQACGAINGLIYCAGGTNNAESDRTYVYDPVADAWTQLADMPQTQWGMGYTAAPNGKLYISGGVTDNFTTNTNEGFVYDPDMNTWTQIENSINAVFNGGSACGFYRIGGITGDFVATAASEVYPLSGDCANDVNTPWLSENPTEGTVAPSQTQDILVTLDASQVSAPGDYFARIRVKGNTPYPSNTIDVVMHVMPACLLCDDFEDGVLAGNWTYKEKWTEAGGKLSSKTTKSATALASPVFAGCQNCSVKTSLSSTGGSGSSLSVYAWYVDTQNYVELTIKEDDNKVILEHRINNVVVAKKHASRVINPNTFYDITMSYDGINIVVNMNGVNIITMAPVGTLPVGTVGFVVKKTTGSFSYIEVQ